MPLAERLLYRNPAKKLDLSFTAPQTKFAPGQKAELMVKSLNENQGLAKSHVLAMVVEESAAHAVECVKALFVGTQCVGVIDHSAIEFSLYQILVCGGTGKGSADAEGGYSWYAGI